MLTDATEGDRARCLWILLKSGQGWLKLILSFGLVILLIIMMYATSCGTFLFTFCDICMHYCYSCFFILVSVYAIMFYETLLHTLWLHSIEIHLLPVAVHDHLPSVTSNIMSCIVSTFCICGVSENVQMHYVVILWTPPTSCFIIWCE